MTINKDAFGEEFMKLTQELGKLTSYQQMVQYPIQLNLFFERIYNSGFRDGFNKAEIEIKTKISKQN